MHEIDVQEKFKLKVPEVLVKKQCNHRDAPNGYSKKDVPDSSKYVYCIFGEVYVIFTDQAR